MTVHNFFSTKYKTEQFW